jgi:three-Cys-motif partner protein
MQSPLVPKSLIPAAYDGREQALVKHRLLEDYLEKLFLIIGMASKAGGPSELCYIDCFAGPWRDSSEAMESTSIAISLKTLDTCRQKLASLRAFVKIGALYVEQDPRAFARLQTYLQASTPRSVHADCMQGDFVALRHDILKWAGPSAFCFFFIDPMGYSQIAIPTLRPLLERPRSEFLINLMYDHLNRVLSMAKTEAAMTEWLGRRLDLSEVGTPQGRESTILAAYQGQAKACMAVRPGYPARAASARVLDPQRNRPKYHLVYLTSHPKGLVKFSEISDQVARLQDQLRAVKRETNRERDTGTTDMFGPPASMPDASVYVHPAQVDRFWREYLAHGPRQIDTAAFADILEQTGWFEKDLQASLLRLLKAGCIVNRAASASRRTAKPLHYDEARGECLEWVSDARRAGDYAAG